MSAIVSIKDLHKSFGTNKVLNGVSLDVQKGQMVAIIGRSGSGKSTLLRCLNGLERIDSGDINVCGHDIHHRDLLNLRELRKQVGIVFQSYNLFPHVTVERNITLALTTIKKMATAEAKKIAHNVLTLVGLEGQEGRLSRAALGWPGATCGDCTFAGDGTGTDAVRRGDVSARSGTDWRSIEDHGGLVQAGHDHGAGDA